MTISLTRAMSAINERVIPKFWLGYFRENFRGEVNDQLLQHFELDPQTKADIARKLDKRPEQITRWLSAPCNLEIDTISDLALSLGLVPTIRFEKIGNKATNEQIHSFIAIQERPIQVSVSTGNTTKPAVIASDLVGAGVPIPFKKRISRSTNSPAVMEIAANA